MRIRQVLVVFVACIVWLAAAGCDTGLREPPAAITRSQQPEVRDLLVSIGQDVLAILEKFSGGLDNPNNPISNAESRRDAAEHLDSAQRKAAQLAEELNNSQKEPPGRGR